VCVCREREREGEWEREREREREASEKKMNAKREHLFSSTYAARREIQPLHQNVQNWKRGQKGARWR